MIDFRLLAILDMMTVPDMGEMSHETGKGTVIGIIIVIESVTMTVEILDDQRDIAIGL
jgi:hypothetical protein